MSASVLHASIFGGASPIATALVAGGRTWTIGDLRDAVDQCATALRKVHNPAEPIACAVADPAAATIATLGCDLLDVPVLHLDPASSERPGLPTLTTSGSSADGAEEVPLGVCGLVLRRAAVARSWRGLPPGSHTFLTSGSTGTPVGVVRSAAAVVADARRVATHLGYGPDAPVVNATPLFHVYGFNYGLVAPLLAGAPVVHVPTRSVPSQLARAVHRHGARVLIGLPFHYGLLADGLATPSPALQGFAALRVAVSAGAPLAAGVPARIASGVPFTLHNCYGSSEAGAVTLAPVDGTTPPGSVGPPLSGVSARLAGPADDAPAGELLLRTDSLAVGRVSDGRLAPLTGVDGWFRTGDLARFSADGGIELTGRIGTLINVAGKKVNPTGIERVLAEHPAVLEAHVRAAADGTRGQVPVARVVLRNPDADVIPVLVAWCRDRLEPHEVPRRIEPVAGLPRSATGKVLHTGVEEP